MKVTEVQLRVLRTLNQQSTRNKKRRIVIFKSETSPKPILLPIPQRQSERRVSLETFRALLRFGWIELTTSDAFALQYEITDKGRAILEAEQSMKRS